MDGLDDFLNNLGDDDDDVQNAKVDLSSVQVIEFANTESTQNAVSTTETRPSGPTLVIGEPTKKKQKTTGGGGKGGGGKAKSRKLPEYRDKDNAEAIRDADRALKCDRCKLRLFSYKCTSPLENGGACSKLICKECAYRNEDVSKRVYPIDKELVEDEKNGGDKYYYLYAYVAVAQRFNTACKKCFDPVCQYRYDDGDKAQIWPPEDVFAYLNHAVNPTLVELTVFANKGLDYDFIHSIVESKKRIEHESVYDKIEKKWVREFIVNEFDNEPIAITEDVPSVETIALYIKIHESLYKDDKGNVDEKFLADALVEYSEMCRKLFDVYAKNNWACTKWVSDPGVYYPYEIPDEFKPDHMVLIWLFGMETFMKFFMPVEHGHLNSLTFTTPLNDEDSSLLKPRQGGTNLIWCPSCTFCIDHELSYFQKPIPLTNCRCPGCWKQLCELHWLGDTSKTFQYCMECEYNMLGHAAEPLKSEFEAYKSPDDLTKDVFLRNYDDGYVEMNAAFAEFKACHKEMQKPSKERTEQSIKMNHAQLFFRTCKNEQTNVVEADYSHVATKFNFLCVLYLLREIQVTDNINAFLGYKNSLVKPMQIAERKDIMDILSSKKDPELIPKCLFACMYYSELQTKYIELVNEMNSLCSKFNGQEFVVGTLYLNLIPVETTTRDETTNEVITSIVKKNGNELVEDGFFERNPKLLKRNLIRAYVAEFAIGDTPILLNDADFLDRVYKTMFATHMQIADFSDQLFKDLYTDDMNEYRRIKDTGNSWPRYVKKKAEDEDEVQLIEAEVGDEAEEDDEEDGIEYGKIEFDLEDYLEYSDETNNKKNPCVSHEHHDWYENLKRSAIKFDLLYDKSKLIRASKRREFINRKLEEQKGLGGYGGGDDNGEFTIDPQKRKVKFKKGVKDEIDKKDRDAFAHELEVLKRMTLEDVGRLENRMERKDPVPVIDENGNPDRVLKFDAWVAMINNTYPRHSHKEVDEDHYIQQKLYFTTGKTLFQGDSAKLRVEIDPTGSDFEEYDYNDFGEDEMDDDDNGSQEDEDDDDQDDEEEEA